MGSFSIVLQADGRGQPARVRGAADGADGAAIRGAAPSHRPRHRRLQVQTLESRSVFNTKVHSSSEQPAAVDGPDGGAVRGLLPLRVRPLARPPPHARLRHQPRLVRRACRTHGQAHTRVPAQGIYRKRTSSCAAGPTPLQILQ